MALREDDHVTGGHLDLVFAQKADEAASLGEDVVRDEVVGARHDPGRQLARVPRRDAPWLGGFDTVEIRTVQADHAEEVGEGVH